jgi:hypothetical protein
MPGKQRSLVSSLTPWIRRGAWHSEVAAEQRIFHESVYAAWKAAGCLIFEEELLAAIREGYWRAYEKAPTADVERRLLHFARRGALLVEFLEDVGDPRESPSGKPRIP